MKMRMGLLPALGVVLALGGCGGEVTEPSTQATDLGIAPLEQIRPAPPPTPEPVPGPGGKYTLPNDVVPPNGGGPGGGTNSEVDWQAELSCTMVPGWMWGFGGWWRVPGEVAPVVQNPPPWIQWPQWVYMFRKVTINPAMGTFNDADGSFELEFLCEPTKMSLPKHTVHFWEASAFAYAGGTTSGLAYYGWVRLNGIWTCVTGAQAVRGPQTVDLTTFFNQPNGVGIDAVAITFSAAVYNNIVTHWAGIPWTFPIYNTVFTAGVTYKLPDPEPEPLQ